MTPDLYTSTGKIPFTSSPRLPSAYQLNSDFEPRFRRKAAVGYISGALLLPQMTRSYEHSTSSADGTISNFPDQSLKTRSKAVDIASSFVLHHPYPFHFFACIHSRHRSSTTALVTPPTHRQIAISVATHSVFIVSSSKLAVLLYCSSFPTGIAILYCVGECGGHGEIFNAFEGLDWLVGEFVFLNTADMKMGVLSHRICCSQKVKEAQQLSPLVRPLLIGAQQLSLATYDLLLPLLAPPSTHVSGGRQQHCNRLG
ncbi:hypothetical protein C8R46DRAFT_241578 [Mycena filopes]|nr:hypothetical protein C8R46DRAFT_241578 [Mycena filopes]